MVGQALARGNAGTSDVVAVGITNQRETTVVWDKTTGRPVHNAIVWQDTRTGKICDELAALGGGAERYKDRVGLPLATYFAGPKVRWVLDNVDGAREKAEAGDLLMGTIDSWLIWNMTGGTDGGLHITDVSNASRTMLMDYRTLEWLPDIAEEMGIPMSMLPEIRSNSEVYGKGRAAGLPRRRPDRRVAGGPAGGHVRPGLLREGHGQEHLRHGQLHAAQHRRGGRPVGERPADDAVLQARRRQAGVRPRGLDRRHRVAGAVGPGQPGHDQERARDRGPGPLGGRQRRRLLRARRSPACSPRTGASDARGAVVGLTRFVNKGHLARAVLEATAFQTREVLDAMNADSGVDLTELRVDGGMVGNELLMQFQADVLDVPVIRPEIVETTALGAAYAAGLAVGFWSDLDELTAKWAEDKRWEPQADAEERERNYRNWQKAVTKTLDWVDDDVS